MGRAVATGFFVGFLLLGLFILMPTGSDDGPGIDGAAVTPDPAVTTVATCNPEQRQRWLRLEAVLRMDDATRQAGTQPIDPTAEVVRHDAALELSYLKSICR